VLHCACWEGGLGLLYYVIVVAVYCSVVLQFGAVCCSVLYCACRQGGLRLLRCVIVVAVCYSVLQSVAVSRSAEGRCLLYCGIVVAVLCCCALQCAAVSCWAGGPCCAVVFDNWSLCCAMCCSVAMCCSSVPMFCSSVAMYCNVLQCVATCRNVLQRVAMSQVPECVSRCALQRFARCVAACIAACCSVQCSVLQCAFARLFPQVLDPYVGFCSWMSQAALNYCIV